VIKLIKHGKITVSKPKDSSNLVSKTPVKPGKKIKSTLHTLLLVSTPWKLEKMLTTSPKPSVQPITLSEKPSEMNTELMPLQTEESITPTINTPRRDSKSPRDTTKPSNMRSKTLISKEELQEVKEDFHGPTNKRLLTNGLSQWNNLKKLTLNGKIPSTKT